jgi:hypothetical protein
MADDAFRDAFALLAAVNQEDPDAIRIVLENADDIKSVAAICAKWYVDMIAYAHSNWDGPTVEETIRYLGARAATDDEGDER